MSCFPCSGSSASEEKPSAVKDSQRARTSSGQILFILVFRADSILLFIEVVGAFWQNCTAQQLLSSSFLIYN
jgi:hypothetical protein